MRAILLRQKRNEVTRKIKSVKLKTMSRRNERPIKDLRNCLKLCFKATKKKHEHLQITLINLYLIKLSDVQIFQAVIRILLLKSTTTHFSLLLLLQCH